MKEKHPQLLLNLLGRSLNEIKTYKTVIPRDRLKLFKKKRQRVLPPFLNAILFSDEHLSPVVAFCHMAYTDVCEVGVHDVLAVAFTVHPCFYHFFR